MSRRKNRKKHYGTTVMVSGWTAPKNITTYGSNALGHVVLAGDSIFDNESYTNGLPDVAQRTHSMLPDHAVSLVARDGATTHSLGYQAQHIPSDASHLIVSIGGNDANGNFRILRDQTQRTMLQSLEELWIMKETFALSYAEAMDPLLALGIPVTPCTIYNCDFDESVAIPAETALELFNAVIISYAFTRGLRLMDLRMVCNEPSDFELQIEPSGTGGAKIGAAIAHYISTL